MSGQGAAKNVKEVKDILRKVETNQHMSNKGGGSEVNQHSVTNSKKIDNKFGR